MTPHDRLFQSTFSQLPEAKSLLMGALPAPLLARLDLSTLRIESNHFVGEQLDERITDLVFEITDTKGRRVVVPLVEHQSSVQSHMVVRMHDYRSRIWARYYETDKYLPLVIPLIIYHGTAPWTAPRTLAELFQLDETEQTEAGHLLPKFEVLVVDLGTWPDELRALTRTASFMLNLLRVHREFEEVLALVRAYSEWFAGIEHSTFEQAVS